MVVLGTGVARPLAVQRIALHSVPIGVGNAEDGTCALTVVQEIKSDPNASVMSVEVFIVMPPFQTKNSQVPLAEPASGLVAG